MSSLKIYQDENCELFKDCELYFNKKSYIVSTGNNILGFFNLMAYDSKTVLIDYELLKKYRNRGIGSYFYKIIEKYIINNYDYERIILMISYDNYKSIKIATNCSYILDNDFNELDEIQNHNAYVKRIKMGE